MNIVTIGGAWIEARTIIRDLSRSSKVKEILAADLQEGQAKVFLTAYNEGKYPLTQESVDFIIKNS